MVVGRTVGVRYALDIETLHTCGFRMIHEPSCHAADSAIPNIHLDLSHLPSETLLVGVQTWKRGGVEAWAERASSGG